MKPNVAILAAAPLAGCASSQLAGGPAKLGQTVRVGGPTVRPDRVIEDSRCPVNVQCMWAGRVILRVTVAGGRWSRTIDLELGTPITVADGALTLMSVAPERADPRKPLRFTFRFDGSI